MILDVGVARTKVDDVDQAMILWISLPPSYDNLCDNIMYGRSSITVKSIKESLMIKEWQKLFYGSSANNPVDWLFVTRGVVKRAAQEVKAREDQSPKFIRL